MLELVTRLRFRFDVVNTTRLSERVRLSLVHHLVMLGGALTFVFARHDHVRL